VTKHETLMQALKATEDASSRSLYEADLGNAGDFFPIVKQDKPGFTIRPSSWSSFPSLKDSPCSDLF